MNLDKMPHDKVGFGSTVHLKDAQRTDDRLSARDAGRRRPRARADFDRVADRPRARRQGRRRRSHGHRRPNGSRRFEIVKLVTIHDEEGRRRDHARSRRSDSYSTRLRTALVLTGTGTAGAYHAGVLRALHEAGIKIDLVAGRGVGVARRARSRRSTAARGCGTQPGLWTIAAAPALLRLAAAAAERRLGADRRGGVLLLSRSRCSRAAVVIVGLAALAHARRPRRCRAAG